MNHLFASYTYQNSLANMRAPNGTPFQAQPLKQWRKAYQNNLSFSRASTGMPMDRPGGFAAITTNTLIYCRDCKGAGLANIPVFNDSPCKSCAPITNKVQLAATTRYTDNAAYLQSRCVTFNQKLSTIADASVNYFSPDGQSLEPSVSVKGPQVRVTKDCSKPCLTIYKPNNTQFAQQGGVSSSSRLARLKYNTLNNNGAEYVSADGAFGVNSGRYQIEPTAYFTKNKPQKVVITRKPGDKIYCKPTLVCTT
jgi:hypothetical protein